MVEKTSHGRLIVVGTPLGSLDDLSPRARATLADVDLILAEDTRVTARLLAAIGVSKPLVSYHAHNEAERLTDALQALARGAVIALVSDAGMPAISDPGAKLVAAAHDAGATLAVVPGPSAVTTALAVSGLDTRRFVFEGFLDAKGAARKARLRAIASASMTVVFYEAPHRLARTLDDIIALGLGPRRLAVARELTKRYETITRSTVDEVREALDQTPPRGEHTLCLEGLDAYIARCPENAHDRTDEAFRFASEEVRRGADRQTLRRCLERGFGLSRNAAYKVVDEALNGAPVLE